MFEPMRRARGPQPVVLIALEAKALSVAGKDWWGKLDKSFQESLKNSGRQYRNSVQGLLRLLRNTVSRLQCYFNIER